MLVTFNVGFGNVRAYRPGSRNSIVLATEPDRGLNRRDVAEVGDVSVVAEIAATASVARTLDTGLLATRLRRLLEFRALRHLVARVLSPKATCTASGFGAASTSSPTQHKLVGHERHRLAGCAKGSSG